MTKCTFVCCWSDTMRWEYWMHLVSSHHLRCYITHGRCLQSAYKTEQTKSLPILFIYHLETVNIMVAIEIDWELFHSIGNLDSNRFVWTRPVHAGTLYCSTHSVCNYSNQFRINVTVCIRCVLSAFAWNRCIYMWLASNLIFLSDRLECAVDHMEN